MLDVLTPDLLPALAERLLVVLKRHWTHPEMMSDGVAEDLEQDADACAREALAFVAEQLPTREEVAAVLYENFSEEHTPGMWAARVADDPTDEVDERSPFLFQADALLRGLRERLGQP